MTRKWFLSLLGIGAAGQQIVPIPFSQEDIDRLGIGRRVTLPKPANGECPVCGTMAPAYVRDKTLTVYYSDGETYKWQERLMEAKTRTVSCSHCRVRFDQDAENPK